MILNSKFTYNVTKIPKFLENGYISGVDSGINFVVINPEFYDINIWMKNKGIEKKSIFGLPYKKYRNTAKTIGANVFTNGPFMHPIGPKKIFSFKIGLKFAYIFPFWPWKPYGTVIHNGKIIEYEENNTMWFGRVGTGSFHYYKIENKIPKDAVEGIIGHPVIRNGKILNTSDDSWSSRGSVCCWGLIPFDREKKSGIILVVGSRSKTGLIAQKMLDAGVIDAIGVDGGTSAMMGEGNKIFFECKWYKDKIQKYGLCVTKIK
jgi:exopolysaccharide biosynthesis protein